MLNETEIMKSFDKSANKTLRHYAVLWDEETQQVKRIKAKDLPDINIKDEQ